MAMPETSRDEARRRSPGLPATTVLTTAGIGFSSCWPPDLRRHAVLDRGQGRDRRPRKPFLLDRCADLRQRAAVRRPARADRAGPRRPARYGADHELRPARRRRPDMSAPRTRPRRPVCRATQVPARSPASDWAICVVVDEALACRCAVQVQDRLRHGAPALQLSVQLEQGETKPRSQTARADLADLAWIPAAPEIDESLGERR